MDGGPFAGYRPSCERGAGGGPRSPPAAHARRPGLRARTPARALRAPGRERAAHLLGGWQHRRPPAQRPLASAAPVIFGIFLVVFAVYPAGPGPGEEVPAATVSSRSASPRWSGCCSCPDPTSAWRRRRSRCATTSRPNLSSPQPPLRALAAELAGFRNDPARYAGPLIEHLDDPDPTCATSPGNRSCAWRAATPLRARPARLARSSGGSSLATRGGSLDRNGGPRYIEFENQFQPPSGGPPPASRLHPACIR